MKTVLGIFCKQPIPGQLKTRLGTDIGPEQAARLYEAFLSDLVERLSSELDERILCFASDHSNAEDYFRTLADGDYRIVAQCRGDLGDRLTAFFDETLAPGDRNVIVIGSDNPTISPALIRKAAGELTHRDAVLGQSTDGGYYLIGLRRMGRQLFDRIPWSTSQVYEAQRQRLRMNRFSMTALEPVTEVDTIEDLETLRKDPLLPSCRNTRVTLSELNLL
jgi:rSAM/selenodomain-associated transferase 1